MPPVLRRMEKGYGRDIRLVVKQCVDAGEAIQRDWAVQLQQKEQHKVVEKLQEKQASLRAAHESLQLPSGWVEQQASLRQLEAAAAQGDADLQRQAS
eukprot:5110331-Amphidinium_carterae.1